MPHEVAAAAFRLPALSGQRGGVGVPPAQDQEQGARRVQAGIRLQESSPVLFSGSLLMEELICRTLVCLANRDDEGLEVARARRGDRSRERRQTESLPFSRGVTPGGQADKGEVVPPALRGYSDGLGDVVEGLTAASWSPWWLRYTPIALSRKWSGPSPCSSRHSRPCWRVRAASE